MTASSVEIGADLRRILLTARTNPERWGRPKGITQDQAAHGAGISAVLYRNLENGYTTTTKVPTLVSICEYLAIPPEDLDQFGYKSVAEGLRIRIQLGNKVILDLDRLAQLTPDEQQALQVILDKLAEVPVRLRGAA